MTKGPRPITLLHLSDLQFGRHHRFGRLGAPEASPDAAFDSLFARLQQDLRDLADADGQPLAPDLVLLTGDLAECGRKSEFEDVLRFTRALASLLALPPERIVIVPGNHDINRALCRAYFDQCEGEETQPRPPYWDKWKHYAWLFRELYGLGARVEFNERTPWSLFEIDDLKLVVAALNTTMAESHRDEDHYGHLGEAQLRWFEDRLTAYQQRGWLRIAALHHNVRRGPVRDDENLRDADDFTRILGGKVNLVLHGHTHDGKLDWLAPAVPILSTGSAAVTQAARPEEVPDQYQMIRVHADRIEHWTRAYAPDRKRWIGDTRADPAGNAWHMTYPVPFTDVAAAFPAPARQPAPAVDHDDLFAGRLDYGHARADFLSRVERVCRLRAAADRADARADIERRRIGTPAIEYLEVCTSERGMTSLYPVGAIAAEVTPESLAEFTVRVHDRYRAADPGVRSTLVYGGPPASDALVAQARAQRVDLRSFVEYQGLIDFRAHVRDQTRRLEEDRRYPPPLYVPQRLRYRVFDEEHLAQNAITHVMAWLHEPDAQLVLVLGEFGTGKSFLLRELARRLGAGDGLVPIFIDMRDLDKGRTLDELLGQYFARYRREFSPDRFAYMLEAGRIALLFDGFDELAVRLTYPRAAEHFDAVLEAVRGSAKVVVTSRTQHFQSDQQVTALGRKVRAHASARIATLQPFDHDQIRAFLRNRFGDDQRAEERLALIDEVKDLLGLSHNPRMLSFIADLDETALRAARDAHGDITAASLYRTILDTWLAHEHARIHPRGAPPSLPVTELRAAVSALAVRMWSRSAPHLGLDELTHDAAALVQRLAETTLDADMAAFQVGSGSLLVRDSEGRFSFLHQSILEWLVADTAATELRTQGASTLPAAAPMSALMAQFFVDLSGREIAHRWVRTALAGAGDDPGTAIAKKNALLVIERAGLANEPEPLVESAEAVAPIVLAGQDLTGQDLSGQDLRGHDLSGANLSDAVLAGANLSGARLTQAILTGADLTRASLQNADLREADFSRATLIGAELRGAAMKGAVFGCSKLVGARWDPGALDDCYTFGAALDAQAGCRSYIATAAPARDIVWGPHGLLAAAGENTVRIWDPESGHELFRLKAHMGLVRSIALSPDGATLATGSDDWLVHLWRVSSGQEIARLQGHLSIVRSVAFNPVGTILASGSDDGTVRTWNLANGRAQQRLHAGHVRSLAFSPDGRLLASGISDGMVRVWDVASGHELMSLKGHTYEVRSVAFSPDGLLLASGSDDGTVQLWAVGDGQKLMRLETHVSVVNKVAFHPDGKLLATGSRDQTVQLWDVASGHRIMRQRHEGDVNSLAFRPDGKVLASSSRDEIVGLDLTSHRETLRIEGHDGWVRSVVFSPDGTRLACSSRNGMVQVWNVAAGQEVLCLQMHQHWEGNVAFSPDGGTRLASGSWDAVQLWDVDSGQRVARLPSAPGLVSSVAFNPDGTCLASGSARGAIRLCQLSGGHNDVHLLGHAGLVTSLVFSPDGAYLASSAEDGTVRLWHVTSGSEHLRLQGHQGSVWNVAINPSGTQLATCGADTKVRLWSVASGRETMRFQEYDVMVTSVAFSPDGTYLVGGASDGSVRLWDVARGSRAVMALQGHESVVTSVAFSPDGRYLATGAWDAARIWSMQTGECLAILAHLPRGWVAMTPDGRYKTGGDVAGGFWHAIGLCRFEPGELDEHIPGLRLPDDAILVPP